MDITDISDLLLGYREGSDADIVNKIKELKNIESQKEVYESFEHVIKTLRGIKDDIDSLFNDFDIKP